MTHKNIMWKSLAWPGTIIHRHIATGQIFEEYGIATGKTDQQKIFAYDYRLTLTAAWEVKNVVINDLLNERQISLKHDGINWSDDTTATVLPEFANIPFIDISVTPFTNSLPIHRLNFPSKAPIQIETLFFDENTFELRKVSQLYAKLDDSTFIYTDVEIPDFSARLTVDNEGIIVDYQHLFKQV